MVSITISWDPVSGADKYRVFHREGPAVQSLDDYTRIAVVLDDGATEYTQTVDSSGPQSYRVVAVSGGTPGKISANASIFVLEQPSGVTFSDTSASGELTVSWDNSGSYTDGFYLYRSSERGTTLGESDRIADVGSPEYTDTSVEGGEQYYYRVTSYNTGNAESDPTPPVTTQPRYETDERVSWWDTLTSGDPVPLDVVDEPGDGADVDVQDGELLVTTDGAVAVPDPDTASVVGIAGTGQKVTLSTESDTTPFSPSSTIYPNDRITLRSDGSTWYILE